MMNPGVHARGEPPLLSLRGLRVTFDGAPRPAVDGAFLDLHAGQMVALVGESGSGKSVTAMSLLGLLPTPPARIQGGSAIFRAAHAGEPAREIDLLKLEPRAMRSLSGGSIAMIFQEPMTSLNPVMTIGDQIVEALRLHERLQRPDAIERATRAMAEVGIEHGARRLKQYPHEFSGGMRQRVMIAMAMACRPAVLLADEPTTALDVTVQAQILELLGEARRARSMGVLFITHDLGIVARHADVVCVMYAGRIVECANVFDLFDNPRHMYTRALLRCVPRLGAAKGRLSTVRDAVDASAEPPRVDGTQAIAWWPSHPRPPGVSASQEDSVMVEAAPDHWVRAWRTPGIVGGDPALPAFIRGGAVHQGGEPCAC